MHSTENAPDLETQARLQVRTLQIIVFSMALGVGAFIGYAVFMQLGGRVQAANNPQNPLPPMAIGLTVVSALASVLVPRIVANNSRKSVAKGAFTLRTEAGAPSPLLKLGDEGALLAIYQTKTIIGAALLEGAAFFDAYVYFTTGEMLPLALGVVCVILIAAKWPTAGRLVGWLEGQLQLLQEEKFLGS